MMSETGLTPDQLRENNGPYLNIAIWTLAGVSTVFLILRVHCKRRQSKGLWWDDHVLAASWAALVLHCAFSTANVAHGFGRHVAALSDPQLRATRLYYKVASTFNITASSWSKTSFAITMLRLTRGRRLSWFIWFVIVSVNVTKAVSAMIGWLGCTPVQKAWDPTLEGGRCWDGTAPANFNMFSGVYSGFMDVVLAIIPWPLIMTLQMRTREKIGVALAMSMGIVAGSAAFVKCAKIPLLTGPDFNCWELIVWGTAETAITIVASSIPVLRVLIHHLRSSDEGCYEVHGSCPIYSGGAHADGAAMHGAVITISGGKVRGRAESCESLRSFEMETGVAGKIVRTNEVKVEVQDREEQGSGVGELMENKVAGTSWPR
ncbi:hypothetical protein VUR80DRAFT_7862 [Thermomyces stellatus]